jgi:hypothetical protein
MDTSINWKMGNTSILCSNVNVIGTWSYKYLSIAGSSFETGCCFAGLSFVGPFKNLFVTDTTTNMNVEEDLSLKDKALLFETDVTTDLNLAEDLSRLNWFVEVMGAHTSDVKVLHETLVVKVTGSHASNAKTLHETFFDKVTGSHANNAKTVHETFFDEVTDSNPVWE